MKPLDSAKNKLKEAKNCIDAMKVSKSFDKFEYNWKNYLYTIEKTWQKACHQLKRSPKFQGWPKRGKVRNLRKKDELLSYLVNSRGADKHTIKDITKRKSGGVGINSPVNVTFYPAKIVLVDVVNGGKTYLVPSKHLGRNLKNSSPIDIAEQSYKFYEEFINEAEENFCK